MMVGKISLVVLLCIVAVVLLIRVYAGIDILGVLWTAAGG
jgi:hypothetical protein